MVKVVKEPDFFDAETGEVLPPPVTANSSLQTYIDRIRRLEEERKAISEDISSIVKEAHKAGFSAPALRKLLSLAKLSKEDRMALNAMCEEVDFWT